MSEEKKNGVRVRFNLLDVALILLVLLCVVSVWQRGNLQRLFEGEAIYEAYNVSFKTEPLLPSDRELLPAETVFYTEKDGTKLKLGTLNDNVSVVSSADEKESLVTALEEFNGTLTCRLLVKEDKCFLEGQLQLAVGQVLEVQTETADFQIVITSIEKQD